MCSVQWIGIHGITSLYKLGFILQLDNPDIREDITVTIIRSSTYFIYYVLGTFLELYIATSRANIVFVPQKGTAAFTSRAGQVGLKYSLSTHRAKGLKQILLGPQELMDSTSLKSQPLSTDISPVSGTVVCLGALQWTRQAPSQP